MSTLPAASVSSGVSVAPVGSGESTAVGRTEGRRCRTAPDRPAPGTSRARRRVSAGTGTVVEMPRAGARVGRPSERSTRGCRPAGDEVAVELADPERRLVRGKRRRAGRRRSRRACRPTPRRCRARASPTTSSAGSVTVSEPRRADAVDLGVRDALTGRPAAHAAVVGSRRAADVPISSTRRSTVSPAVSACVVCCDSTGATGRAEEQRRRQQRREATHTSPRRAMNVRRRGTRRSWSQFRHSARVA